MNEDLARALDDLLSWLDRRYQPAIKKTLTERQYAQHWELDKIQFREKVMSVVESSKITFTADPAPGNNPSE